MIETTRLGNATSRRSAAEDRRDNGVTPSSIGRTYRECNGHFRPYPEEYSRGQKLSGSSVLPGCKRLGAALDRARRILEHADARATPVGQSVAERKLRVVHRIADVRRGLARRARP